MFRVSCRIFLVSFLLYLFYTVLPNIFCTPGVLMPVALCFTNHISVILVTGFVLMLVRMSNDNVFMSTFTSHILLCLYILLFLIVWILHINENMISIMTWPRNVHPIVLFQRLLSYSKCSNSHSNSWCQNNIFKRK